MEKNKKMKTCAVYVSSLNHGVEDDDLKDAFQSYGPISSAVVIKDKKTGKSKGYGYVNFYSREVAEVAAAEMNETCILGTTINASLKKEKKETGSKTITDESKFIEGTLNSGANKDQTAESLLFKNSNQVTESLTELTVNPTNQQVPQNLAGPNPCVQSSSEQVY